MGGIVISKDNQKNSLEVTPEQSTGGEEFSHMDAGGKHSKERDQQVLRLSAKSFLQKPINK
jgi:hypothetical protein